MKNPIFDELIKLKLISKKNLITLSHRTRDKKIKVIKDLKTKIIFLEKYITNNEYYSSLKYNDDGRKVFDKSNEKNPAIINPGDRVIFYEINKDQYLEFNE